jgi:hypothetical protein
MSTPQDLAFLLREQAWDRFNDFKAEHGQGSTGDPLSEDDRLEAGPGQMLQEYRRLRHSAELAEQAYRLAEQDPDESGSE